MNEEKLAKIKALAEDRRGDPATRAIAQRAYARYAKEPPPRVEPEWQPRNAQHEGMKTSPEYDRYMFLNLGGWRKSKNGNPYHTTKHKGLAYHFVLFQHKKSPTWGWLRTNQPDNEQPVFSGRFNTLAEAHADAWKKLQMI
jgi:hypothetical protein